VSAEQRTTTLEAKRVGDEIGVDWDRFDLEQFRAGMDVEYEHGSHDPQTDVTGDDPIITGKIALAHMKEFPCAWSAWSERQSRAGNEPSRPAETRSSMRRELWAARLFAGGSEKRIGPAIGSTHDARI
jgi:Protein of unknown function (DUF5661)